jgi:NAD(P)-dependent dehydrogenase (short-subunit alcohol dehydrogenase family)
VKVFTITPGRFRSSLLDGLTTSPEAKRWFGDPETGREVEPERVANLVTFLASGAGDGLSGRFLHALDDFEDLAARADEIARADLFAVRLRRPSG